jgi:hypothetical protein
MLYLKHKDYIARAGNISLRLLLMFSLSAVIVPRLIVFVFY